MNVMMKQEAPRFHQLSYRPTNYQNMRRLNRFCLLGIANIVSFFVGFLEIVIELSLFYFDV